MAATQDGIVIKQTVYTFKSQTLTNNVNPYITEEDCCDNDLLVIADENAPSDNYKNDKSGVLFNLIALTNSSALYLEKFNYENSTWSQQTALNDNSYGDFFSLSFYTNAYNEKYIGYKLNWAFILPAFGAGRYRVKCAYTDVFNNSKNTYSYNFLLRKYSVETANDTVRLEYYSNKYTGDKNNQKRYFDYGALNWYNSIRVYGIFGYPTPKKEVEYQKYTNEGKMNWVKDSVQEEYELKTRLHQLFIHRILYIDVSQSDEIYVTDYNVKNETAYIDVPVKAHEYTREYYENAGDISNGIMKFSPRHENLNKRRA